MDHFFIVSIHVQLHSFNEYLTINNYQKKKAHHLDYLHHHPCVMLMSYDLPNG